MLKMDAGFTWKHYFDLEERLGAEVYSTTATFMQSGPVIALVLEGVDAAAKVRKIIGTTYQAAPGTIRGNLAHQAKVSSEGSDKIGLEDRGDRREGVVVSLDVTPVHSGRR
jgi:nucleoside-diphosphate kinase